MNKPTGANLNYQNKITLSVLIFLLAAGVFIYFIARPSMEKIKMIKIETEKQGAQVEKDYLAGKNLKKQAENLKIIEPQLGAFDKIFIKKPGYDFITALEDIAGKNSVTMKDPSLGTEKKLDKTYSQIPLQLETRGDFASQIGCLSGLEALDYYLNIKTLEISAANTSLTPSGEAKKHLVMQIVADTYWQN
jgi:Tfp pilus assembly protein PilO